MTQLDFLQLSYAAGYTLLLAAAAVPLAAVIGAALTAMKRSSILPLSLIYALYIWLIRGTPLLLLAMAMFFSLASLGLRLNPYIIGILVIAIYHSAFYAEIFQASVEGISGSLRDSGRSLGLSPWATFRFITLPLALRAALPASIGVCVMIVKASSVLSVIGVWELTYAGREITERTLDVFTVLMLTAGIYFCFCFALDRLGKSTERYLERRGFQPETPSR